MGNLCSCGEGGGNDNEKNKLAVSLADAASTGAREGIIVAFKKAEEGEQNGTHSLIGGILSIERAKKAAAAAAKRELDSRAQELNFFSRFVCDLEQIKNAAASGAEAGLQEIENLFKGADIEENGGKVIDSDIAAAAGARVACFISAQMNVTPKSGNYTALLGPMLGGSFPASVAVYNLLSKSSDVVKLCVFGGLVLAVFVIMSGLAAGSLGRTARSIWYTRLAALVAVTIVLSLFVAALCSLLSSQAYKAVCGAIGGILIMIFVVSWLISKW